MKKYLLKLCPIIILLVYFSCPINNTGSSSGSEQSSDTGTDSNNFTYTMSITQYGITWYFKSTHLTGQFVNGDYWVVGPVHIVHIDPEVTNSSNGYVINGSMVNPVPNENQGYGGNRYYDESLNVARNISNDNPLILNVNESLISSIGTNPINEDNPYLKTAAILTCMPSAPPEGSFRPAYCDTNKTLYNVSNVEGNLNKLKSLSCSGNPYTLSQVESMFEKPWLDHISNLLVHPSDNMPGYGREFARDVGVGALFLHLNYTNEDKYNLLVRYVQLGIDLYGIARNGGNNNWYPDGGHNAGRKWPIIFAGIMLNNNDMINIGPGDCGTVGDLSSNYVQFQEDAQTWYVNNYAVNTMQPYDGTIDIYHYQAPYQGVPYGGYIASDIGMPEWGGQHSKPEWGPTVDSKAWGIAYRNSCTALAWKGFVLAALLMDAKDQWNHDALFDYMDRFVLMIDDPSGPKYGDWYSNWDQFASIMWNLYRGSIPVSIQNWVTNWSYSY